MSFFQSSFFGSVLNCRLASLRVLCLFSFFWLPLTSTLAQESIIYSQSFSDCSELTFGNAAEQGYSQYSDGVNFECTTQGPSGLYNWWVGGDGDGSAAPAPLFETADDGFVMVDSDLLGSEGAIENCWFELNEPVDCSGFSEVSIAFDTFYRRWQKISVERASSACWRCRWFRGSGPTQPLWERMKGLVMSWGFR